MESVTAVRYVKSAILREGLGARICERKAKRGLKPNRTKTYAKYVF